MGVNTLFLDTVWGPLTLPASGRQLYGEVRAFKRGGATNQFFFRSSSEAMKTALDLSLNSKMDVYFGVMRRIAQSGRAVDCIDTTRILWADFDAKNFRAKTGFVSAYSEIANMRLIPHIIVDSGHGYHAYWLLDREYPFGEAQAVMKGMEKVHRTDHCSDQPRILRLPGTLNYKDASPLPVRLVRFDASSRPYTLDAFNEYLNRYTPPEKHYQGNGTWEPSGLEAPKLGVGERNGGMMRVAAAMVHKGLSPDDVVNNLLIENELRCEPPLPEAEVEAIARSVERYRE